MYIDTVLDSSGNGVYIMQPGASGDSKPAAAVTEEEDEDDDEEALDMDEFEANDLTVDVVSPVMLVSLSLAIWNRSLFVSCNVRGNYSLFVSCNNTCIYISVQSRFITKLQPT